VSVLFIDHYARARQNTSSLLLEHQLNKNSLPSYFHIKAQSYTL
jgi:hypothetical protein